MALTHKQILMFGFQEDGVRTAIHYIYTYVPRAYSEGLSPE
jgi:hypothetical protein